MRNIQKVLAGIFLGGVLIGGIGTGIAIVEYSSLTYGGRKVIGEENMVTKTLDFEFEPDGRTLELIGISHGSIGRKTAVEIDNTVPAGTVRYQVTYNERTVTPYLDFEEYEEEQETVREPEWEQQTVGMEESEESDGVQQTAGMEESEKSDGAQQMAGIEESEGETQPEGSEESDGTQQESSEKSGCLGYLRLGAEYHDDGFALLMENKDSVLEDLKQKKLSSYDVAYITEITVQVNSDTMPYIKSPYVIR